MNKSSETKISSANNDVQRVLRYLADASPEQREYISDHFSRVLEDTFWIEQNCSPSDTIIDIGSFPWFTPAYLSLRGFSYIHAVDISRKDVFKKAREWKFRSSTLDIETKPIPVKSGTADVVVLYEIFEHLYHRPNFVFREITRVLKKGGRLILSTPNGASFQALNNVLCHRRMGQPLYDLSAVYEDIGHFSHIREYSLQELREYLIRFGFSVEYHHFRTHANEAGRRPWSTERVVSALFPSLRRN